MSFGREDLTNAIGRVLSSYHDNDTIDPVVVTLEVLRNEVPEYRVEDGMLEWCAYQHVRKIVGQKARSKKPNNRSGESPEQIEMYPLVQARYPCLRDGRLQDVPRQFMSAQERRDAAESLRKEAGEKMEHADQLDRETDALIATGKLAA